MMVEVEDSTGNCISEEVPITVNGVSEPPLAPTRPTVVSYDDPDTEAADESTKSLKVIWHPPENAGGLLSTAMTLSTRRAPQLRL